VKLGGEAAKVYLFRKHSGLDYDRLTGILLALKYYSILPFMCLALFFAGFALINFDLPRLALAALAFLILFFAVVALIYYKAGSNSAHNQEHATPEIWLAGTETYNNMNLIGKVLLTFKKRLAKIILLLTRAGIFARSMTNRLERFALISLSTLVWLTYPVKVLLFARMLGLDIGLFSIAVITFTAYLISMVPLLPGGLGSYEATMALMFTLYGFTPAEGITVALLTRLVTYWFPLVISALAAAVLAYLSKPHELSKATSKSAGHVDRAETTLKSPFFSVAQISERLAVRFAFVARIYFNLFYKNMLAREVALAGLKKGASILHIGGGAYPFTAIYLAQKGYRVHACDCSSSAAEIAKSLVNKHKLNDQVKVFIKNGCLVDSSNYDAVWVSLNICPKERVLEQAWASLKESGILVYRKLPAWLALLGRRDVSFTGDQWSTIKIARSGFGSESLSIEKVRSYVESSKKISVSS
jgi:uncharacterized protein (TIRG00374 family)